MSIRPGAIAMALMAAQLWLAQAQQPPQTFKSQTELVLVPVIAHRSGKHVPGLTKDDFALQQDGKPQPIAVFEEIHAARATAAAADAGTFSNQAIDSQAAQQVTIIAIDTINTAHLDQTYAREQLVRFIEKNAQPDQTFGLVLVNNTGVHVLHDFTKDTKSLLDTMKRVKNGGAMREESNAAAENALQPTENATSSQAAQVAKDLNDWNALMDSQEHFSRFRVSNSRIDTLSSFLQIAQFLAGFPGRKNVVWVSDGVQLFGSLVHGRGSGTQGFIPTGNGQAYDQTMYVLHALSAANISIYPVDARHGANASFANYDVNLVNTPMDSSKERTRETDQEAVDGFQRVAAATGGKPCFNRTDLDNCFRDALDESRDYYMLGFYVDRASTKPGWHPITVASPQKLELRYRQGFAAEVPNAEQARATDVQLALASPVAFTALPFTGSFGAQEAKGSKKIVNFALRIPPGAVRADASQEKSLSFDVAVSVRSAGGKEVMKLAHPVSRKLNEQQAATILADGIDYKNKLELAPGEYGVWFVVRDNLSGRTGSAMATLKVD